MRNFGSLSNKNMGLSSKIDEGDTDISFCFSIQVIVSVGFSSSDGTQIDSQSKMATLLKKVCSLVYSILNSSSFSNIVSLRVSTFLGVKVFDSVPATEKMAVELVCFVEKCIVSWASEAFEEIVDVIDVNIVVVVS